MYDEMKVQKRGYHLCPERNPSLQTAEYIRSVNPRFVLLCSNFG